MKLTINGYEAAVIQKALELFIDDGNEPQDAINTAMDIGDAINEEIRLANLAAANIRN